MAKSTLKRLISQADSLCSDLAYLMASGKCCKCTKVGTKDDGFCIHHIIRKGMGGGNIKTRFRMFNILWICPFCHTSGSDPIHNFTTNQEMAFIEREHPQHYRFLTQEADRTPLEGNIVDFVRESIAELEMITAAVKEGSG